MSNSVHIARRPREIADCVGAYLREGDLDGIVSMFHPDCRIFFPPDSAPSVGLAGARQAFEAFVDMRPQLKSRTISEVIAGDVALTGADWQVVAPDGTVIAEGRSIEVARKLDNGGWGYLIDCPNGAPPAEK